MTDTTQQDRERAEEWIAKYRLHSKRIQIPELAKSYAAIRQEERERWRGYGFECARQGLIEAPLPDFISREAKAEEIAARLAEIRGSEKP